MKKFSLITILFLLPIMVAAQSKILLTVGDKSMTATLVDNEATRTLTSLLEKGPVTISMSDYGGFEKVGALPQPLPASDTGITTVPGDIMLYQGDNMVIFYGSNSWSYTRLGKIEGASVDNLHQFLGSGNISLTVSLMQSDGIADIHRDVSDEGLVFDVQGHRITRRPLTSGIYIINGKKTLIN